MPLPYIILQLHPASCPSQESLENPLHPSSNQRLLRAGKWPLLARALAKVMNLVPAWGLGRSGRGQMDTSTRSGPALRECPDGKRSVGVRQGQVGSGVPLSRGRVAAGEAEGPKLTQQSQSHSAGWERHPDADSALRERDGVLLGNEWESSQGATLVTPSEQEGWESTDMGGGSLTPS